MDCLNLVEVLFKGYSYDDPDDSNKTRANCTCTLIRSRHGKNIIVDTLTAWDGERLCEAIKEVGLGPENISVVVCTHGHSDHIGCNYLFTTAKLHFVGTCVSHHDTYLNWGSSDCSPFELDGNDIVVELTPGHTMSCVSVIVRNTTRGVVGICGDLFERYEDIFDELIWLNAGSENPCMQRKNRLRLAELCDYIIPGHGEGFVVTKDIIEELRRNVETS